MIKVGLLVQTPPVATSPGAQPEGYCPGFIGPLQPPGGGGVGVGVEVEVDIGVGVGVGVDTSHSINIVLVFSIPQDEPSIGPDLYTQGLRSRNSKNRAGSMLSI